MKLKLELDNGKQVEVKCDWNVDGDKLAMPCKDNLFDAVLKAMRDALAKPTLKDCTGCRDNFYNLNGTYCWHLESATFVEAKDVPVDMRPPYTGIPLTKRPDCYHGKGYVRVKPEALTADGYWKT